MNLDHLNIRDQYALRDEYERSDYWYPSDLGQCLAGAFYARKGVPALKEIEPQTIEYMKTGSAVEEGLVRMYEKVLEDYKVETQLALRDETHKLSGKPDLVISKDEEIVAVKEIKVVNCRSFTYRKRAGQMAQDHHTKQLGSYMMLLGVPHGFHGQLLYRKACFADVIEIDVIWTPELEKEIVDELDILNTAWENDKAPELPPAIVRQDVLKFDRYGNAKDKGEKWTVNWKASYCRYHALCTGNEDWLSEAKDEVTRRNNVAEESDGEGGGE